VGAITRAKVTGLAGWCKSWNSLTRATSALLIVQAHPLTAELFAKEAIFFLELFNDILLLLVHPTRQGNQEQSKRTQNEAHWLRLPL
jgi:hypothetical protein